MTIEKTGEKFEKAIDRLLDQFPDDLSKEDWDTLANVLMAYIWNDDFKTQLKEIEQEFLLDKKNSTQEFIKELKKHNICN